MTNKTIFIFLTCTILVATGFAQEESIKKTAVPKGILVSFQKAYPNVKTIGYSRETVEGNVFYEIESTEGTVHRDVTYAADGSLVSVEETLPFEELPEPVRTTITNEYPKAKVTLCERVMKGPTTEFEVLIPVGREKHELVLNVDGVVVKKEVKKNLK